MTVTAVRLGGQPGKPILILGPSLGTSVSTLWSTVASDLASDFDVIGWDLPGHGSNRGRVIDPFEIADLARAVVEMVDEVDGVQTPAAFHYAGDSVGGAVGLQLLIDYPDRVTSAALLCTGPMIGTPEGWRERAEIVRTSGTAALVAASPQRWFGPGFTDRAPETTGRLLDELVDVDDEGYAAVCAALATFDTRDQLATIDTPIVAIAGAHDVVCPPSALETIATGVRRGRFVSLPGVAHLAPVEAPHDVAHLIRQNALAARADSCSVADVRAAGMVVRRQVLGDAHVDRVTAATTDFTREFQHFITEYAWGGIWTRPGLDRRSRSMITLTALVARGHYEELAMHVRAARTNGLSVDEIKELLLQTAIYCGVPDANTAFRVAQGALSELADI